MQRDAVCSRIYSRPRRANIEEYDATLADGTPLRGLAPCLYDVKGQRWSIHWSNGVNELDHGVHPCRTLLKSRGLVSNKPVPTLYEWAGGMPALERLTEHFYNRVRQDEMLAPVFAHMPDDHPAIVARFLAEVLGGPAAYSSERGGHAHMVSRHLNRHLTDAQRKRWMTMLLESADATGLPSDPEFRSALVGYLEWGSRIAVVNSQSSEEPPAGTPMPRWGWGEVHGPYQPVQE